jgi:hypothetical protein
MMSPFTQDPQLIATIHADRMRRLRQESRTRRHRPGNDDRRWG